MFYKNYLNLKKLNYKKVKYCSFSNGLNTDIDENLLPIKYSKNTFNYCYKNGALTDGLGIDKPKLSYKISNKSLKKSVNIPPDVNVLGVWVYNRFVNKQVGYSNYLIIYCSDGNMYYNNMYVSSSNFYKLSEIKFTTCPRVLNYKLNGYDVLIFVTQDGKMYVWDSLYDPELISDAPEITSMCLHNERLFVTTMGERRTVWFSDDLNPTNWNISLNEAGYIEMVDERGILNKVISFNNYLYVFREFGISRITAYSSQENFSVNHLFTTNSRIYPNTIQICGNKIIFLASDGLYSFNGVSTTKINLNINKLLDGVYNDNAQAVYNNGFYYMSCILNFEDEFKIGCENENFINNALVEIDVKNYDFNILRGVDISYLESINDLAESSVLVCYKVGNKITLGQISKSGCVNNVPTRKVWESPKTDFNLPSSEKFLKEFIVESKSNIQIVFNIDGRKKTFNLSGKNNPQTIKPNLKGYQISIDFICDSCDVEISNPQLVLGYANG